MFLDKLSADLKGINNEISVEISKCLKQSDRQGHLVLAAISASLKGTIAVVDAYRNEVKM